MTYHLTKPLGNNAFSYDERRSLGSDTTLVISNPCEISSLDQVQLGDFVVFEELPPLLGEGWGEGFGEGLGVRPCTGLAHTYILSPSPSEAVGRRLGGGKIIITDNHNHVLPYRLDFCSPLLTSETKGGGEVGVRLIHIDQHSDLGPNPNQLDLSQLFAPSLKEKGSGGGYLRDFAHLDCNIGNFITPCIDSGLITDMTQIRTKYKLNEISSLSSLPTPLSPLIVDIDLDFWAPEMGITNIEQTMSQVRSLMDHADLITIATSPYFINQELALDLLHQLLQPRLAKHSRNDTL